MSRYGDLRVVAFGGGTGLPVLLRGLRDRVGDLTAVVTVADDGGSSGRLRQELGVAPPGDVRNCLVALAGRKNLAEVFNYRFEGGGDLSDHSVGNIIIAALADMAGGFCEGVEQAARFLRIKGQVYPAAMESLTLVVRYADGTLTRGESVVHEVGKAVSEVSVEPVEAEAPRGVISAIKSADVVVLSPGSLFTSTIPALLGAGGLHVALDGRVEAAQGVVLRAYPLLLGGVEAIQARGGPPFGLPLRASEEVPQPSQYQEESSLRESTRPSI